MKKWLKNAKGLTLVELLAVIVILGIVAAIAVPAIGGVITKSKTNADAASVKLIQEAAYRYAITENLTAASTTRTVAQLAADGYLESVPTSQTGTGFADVVIAVSAGKVTVTGGTVVGAT